MIRSLQRSRGLRLLLVVLLVPLLVTTQTRVAQAAAQNVRITHTYPGSNLKGTLLSDVTCSLSVVFGDGQATVSGECVGGPDLTPFMTTPGEPGSHASFRLAGDGEVQGNNSMTVLQDHDRDGVGSVAGTIIDTNITFGAEFQPTQLCMSLGPPGLETKFTSTQCVPIVAPRDQVCEGVTFKAPDLSREPGVGVNANGRYHWVLNHAVFTVTNGGTEVADIDAYVIVDGRSGIPQVPSPLIPSAGFQKTRVQIQPGETRDVWVTYTASAESRTNVPLEPVDVSVLGAGVSVYNGGGSIISIFSVPYPDGSPPYAILGRNNPAGCDFYWGEPLWVDETGSGQADPAGPLVVDYPVLPPEEDDTPEESNWWSALWGLLKSIASAIWAIPQAILDGLVGLLIPDEFPDWGSIDIDMPSGWVPELPTVPAGACGPITLPSVDAGMVGSVQAESFIDTCESPWTHARTMIYYGILATAFIVVGQRILRVVMNALGMGVDSPSGGDD